MLTSTDAGGAPRAPDATDQERYPGLEEVHVGQVVGTDEHVVLEQLDRFAIDVMPAVKREMAVVS